MSRSSRQLCVLGGVRGQEHTSSSWRPRKTWGRSLPIRFRIRTWRDNRKSKCTIRCFRSSDQLRDFCKTPQSLSRLLEFGPVWRPGQMYAHPPLRFFVFCFRLIPFPTWVLSLSVHWVTSRQPSDDSHQSTVISHQSTVISQQSSVNSHQADNDNDKDVQRQRRSTRDPLKLENLTCRSASQSQSAAIRR